MKTTTELDVDGYTASAPVPDEDWDDVVRWELNFRWSQTRGHNLNGYLAHPAGSTQCKALGHTPSSDGEWDEDTHPTGWGGDELCVATSYARACTDCESEDCDSPPTDQAGFWKKFEAQNIAETLRNSGEGSAADDD